MIGLPRLHHLALTAWRRTLATTTDPYARGKAEGRVIGVALALAQLQSDTRRVQALQAHTQPEGETHE